MKNFYILVLFFIIIFVFKIKAQDFNLIPQESHEVSKTVTSKKYGLYATIGDKEIKIWSNKTNLLLGTVPIFENWAGSFLGNPFNVATFANEHPWIAAYSDDRFIIYNFESQKLIVNIEFKKNIWTGSQFLHYSPIGDISFSKNDRYLFFSGPSYFMYDTKNKELNYFNDTTQINALGYKGFYHDVNISNNEKYLAYSPIETRKNNDSYFKYRFIKDINNNDTLFQLETTSLLSVFSENDSYVVYLNAGGELRIVDLKLKKEKVINLNLEGKLFFNGQNGLKNINNIVISRDDQVIITFLGNILIYDIKLDSLYRIADANISKINKQKIYTVHCGLVYDSDLNMIIYSTYTSFENDGLYFFDKTNFLYIDDQDKIFNFDDVLIEGINFSQIESDDIQYLDNNTWLIGGSILFNKNTHRFTTSASKRLPIKTFNDGIRKMIFLDNHKLAFLKNDQSLNTIDLLDPTSSFKQMHHIFGSKAVDDYDIEIEEENIVLSDSSGIFFSFQDNYIVNMLKYDTNKDSVIFVANISDSINAKSPVSYRVSGIEKMLKYNDGFFILYTGLGEDDSGDNLVYTDSDFNIKKIIISKKSKSKKALYYRDVHDIELFENKLYVLTKEGISIYNANNFHLMENYSSFNTSDAKKTKNNFIDGNITLIEGRYLHCAMWDIDFSAVDNITKMYNETGIFVVLDTEKDSIIYSEKNRDYTLDMQCSPMYSQSVSCGADYGIKIRDKKGKLIKIIGFRDDLIENPNYTIALSQDGTKAATGSDNGIITIWDTGNWEKIVDVYIYNEDLLFFTPDNYFLTSRPTLEHIAYKKGLSLYPAEQFDLLYNRPDIVLDRLSLTDSTKIGLYKEAHQKRIDKMNISQQPNIDVNEIPELSIKNIDALYSEYGLLTNKMKVPFQLNLKSQTHELLSLFVWVNGVSLFGISGKDLSVKKAREIDLDIHIDLMIGNNKIQFSCMNITGAESYKETIEIVYEPEEKIKPNLYILGIGASDFKNLPKLPNTDNDIRDFVNFYKTKEGDFYKKVYIDTFLNTNVLRDDILAKKHWLHNSTVNDIVIVYYSGHGSIDKNNDYYLFSYDVDIGNIFEYGIKYDDLENLLDSIPARKKVFLVNACHSGEYDQDMKIFKLMKETFPELRRGTGAKTIASSYADEFGLTGSKRFEKNSAFGFAINELFKENQILTINELKTKLEEKVFALSRKRQKPTFRTENIEIDFRIW